jgi:hypothetical protein
MSPPGSRGGVTGMRKPQKAAKATKFRPPADQTRLKTECGHCHTLLPDPSTAAHHLEKEHPGEYA